MARSSDYDRNLLLKAANFDMALSWSELLKRTAHEAVSDDAQGLASQLAYYFFLALFPALLCLLAIASFFPLQNVSDDVVRLLGPFAPREMLEIIRQEMAKIAEGQHGGLVTVGLSLLMIVAFTLIVAGPQLADFAARHGYCCGSIFPASSS